MHRGSSKAAAGSDPPAESLPLSASPTISLTIEVARAASPGPRELRLPAGATARDAVRVAGLAPEGTVVLVDSAPVPLDFPLRQGVHLVVLRAFSGG